MSRPNKKHIRTCLKHLQACHIVRQINEGYVVYEEGDSHDSSKLLTEKEFAKRKKKRKIAKKNRKRK